MYKKETRESYYLRSYVSSACNWFKLSYTWLRGVANQYQLEQLPGLIQGGRCYCRLQDLPAMEQQPDIKHTENQLSQRCRRTTFRVNFVTENFAKSLKVTHSRSFEITLLSTACVTYLLVFHCNYVHIFYHFWDTQRQIMACPWNAGW